MTVDDTEIREARSECVATIMNAIRVALERTPPELSADISDRGIVLTGGGAMLKNLDKRIRQETGLPVSIGVFIETPARRWRVSSLPSAKYSPRVAICACRSSSAVQAPRS